jgi:hypothetical protein
MNAQARMLAATILVGVPLLAAVWFLAIAPKRAERADVTARVATQKARLDRAKAQVDAYAATQDEFPDLLSELRRLDRAVPSRADVSSLLRELQRRARVRGSELRLVSLKEGGAPAGGATDAKPATPGAVAGPGGLSALPFTFEYTGKYFDLIDVLATVRRSVRLEGERVRVRGRLLTIDGLTFKRLDPATPLTKAVVNATAYIAPDGAATPQAPTDAGQAPAEGGS